MMTAQQKIYKLDNLQEQVKAWKEQGENIVFTNGCFDILHQGHLDIINFSAKQGDRLIIAVNSDSSVKKLKGPERPINSENFRAELLASLFMVDAVVLFSEETPIEVISSIIPDVIVKGGDYTEGQVVGADIVKSNGGKVEIFPILESHSTTNTIGRIRGNNEH